MRTLNKRGLMFLYALGGMGVNMLNMIVTARLITGLQIEGFNAGDIGLRTYADRTLIVAVVWSVFVTVAKVIDGIIDIPLATLSDNLRTRWGRRRPALLMGLIPMMLAYVAFLNPVSWEANSIANTVWFGIMLCLFFIFYTLTMGTYYATFSEIVDNEKDRVALSNFKTIFDIVYFLLGYGLIPVLISAHINIRVIGYIFLPLALTMLIPVFMIKEPSNRIKDVRERGEKEKGVSMVKAIKYCFTNKAFVLWMVVYAVLQFGVQMFLTGEDVLYSGTMGFEGFKETLIMAAVFVPVPGTIFLYNKLVNKKGLKFGFLYALSVFIVSMALMSLCRQDVIANDTVRLVVAIIAGLVASFGVGTFFSISYTVPSHLAELQRRRTGDSNPTMYFAVQGLFSGIATAVSTGVVWINLRDNNLSWLLPIIVLAASAVAFGLTFLLPKELNEMGRTGGEGSSAAEAVEEGKEADGAFEESADLSAQEAQEAKEIKDNISEDGGETAE